MERPDLEAIALRALRAEEWQHKMDYPPDPADVDRKDLLAYARHLEAENKRFREGGKKTEAAVLAIVHEARSAREEMEKELERTKRKWKAEE